MPERLREIRRLFSSLRSRLALVVLLATIPAMGLLTVSGMEQRQMAASSAMGRAMQLVNDATHDVADTIEASNQVLAALSGSPVISGARSACSAWLASFLENYRNYTNMGVAGIDGDPICMAVPSAQPINFADRVWFQRAVQTRAFAVGEYQIGRASGKPSLGVGFPLINDGELTAVLFAGLDLTELNRLAASSELPASSSLTVSDRNGTILARYPEPEKWVGQVLPDVSIIKTMLSTGGRGMAEAVGVDGVARLYAFNVLTRAPGQEALISVGIPRDVAYAEADFMLVRNVGSLLLVTLLALAATWFGGDALVLGPVNVLLAATKRLTSGDLKARSNLSHGYGEISQLGRAFDDMAESLQRREEDANRALEQLSKSEQRFRLTLDSLMEGGQIIGFDWRYLYLNNAAAAQFKRSKEELVGHTMIEMYHGIETTEMFAFLRECMHKRVSGRMENLFEFPDGSKEWFELSFDPVPEGIFVMSLDITQRKRSEQAMQENEKRFRALIENSNDSTVLLTADGTCVYASPSTSRISGYGLEEFVGQSVLRLIHASHRDQATALLAEVVCDPGLVRTAELRVVNKDGRPAWIEASLSNLLAERGVEAVVVNWRDITTRKRSQEEIQRHLQRLEALRSIDVAINSSLDLRVTLNVLLDQVTTQTRLDAAAVLLVNQHNQQLEYGARRGFHSDTLWNIPLRMGEGHAGRAAMEHRMVTVPDLSKDPEDSARAPLLAQEKFVAYFAVPLIAKGQLIGILEALHREQVGAEPEWGNFLQALAGQASIAIDNAALFDNLQRTKTELMVAYDATLEGWVHALDLRHRETEGHTLRVTEMAVRLARAFGFSELELVHVHRGALLHDIGKMGIPDGTLLRPGPFTDEDLVIMRQHPELGYQFLSRIAFLRPALDIPYCHHEKWDGTGYPQGLKGEHIPLAARLFAVVDVWDALRSDRVYRAAWPEEKVREHIRSLSGGHFDPRVVDAFMSILESSGA